jgi:hypothetical protein
VPAEIRTTAPVENKPEALPVKPTYSVMEGNFEIETCNEHTDLPIMLQFSMDLLLVKRMYCHVSVTRHRVWIDN